MIKCVQQILCLCIVLFGEKYITHNLLPSAGTGIHPLTPTEDGSLQCFCLRSEVNTGLGDLLKDVSLDLGILNLISYSPTENAASE